MLQFFDDSTAIYESVNNLPAAKPTEKIEVGGFAPIDILNAANCTYANGTITLTDASLSISDTTFLEAGKEYVLKIGLSLKDENGLQSMNTVALSATNEKTTVFQKGAKSLTVSQSGEYKVPTNLSEGNYVVVAYIATADEGIRVSELKEIAFGEVLYGEIPSSAMKVEVEKSNDYLMVHYGIILNVQAELYKKESYTLADIESSLMRAVLMHGYPKTGESVLTEDGKLVSADDAIKSGTYKMKFYMNTEDGVCIR